MLYLIPAIVYSEKSIFNFTLIKYNVCFSLFALHAYTFSYKTYIRRQYKVRYQIFGSTGYKRGIKRRKCLREFKFILFSRSPFESC